MQTRSNEFFYSVSGLMVPNENVNEKIVDYIELFIDQAPVFTEQIKQHLDKANIPAFIMSMKTISSMLHTIYANWLMVETDKIIEFAEADDLALCRKKVTPYITDLLSLSIDLQIAQKNSGTLGRQSTIEQYSDVINNLKAAETLVADKEYDRAIDIIVQIKLLWDNKNAQRLLKFLKEKDYKRAVNAVAALIDEYADLLGDLGVMVNEDKTKKKLLAVDDHSDILVTIRGMLESHFKVYAAAGGKSALSIMEKHSPDIFLLDIEMPDISGFDLAKTIRAFKEHEKTPIIFLTSNATREHVFEALQCGANDFIVKPASYNALMVKISKLIDVEVD